MMLDNYIYVEILLKKEKLLVIGLLGQDTPEPSFVQVNPRKDMNNVNCRRDMTEILLTAA